MAQAAGQVPCPNSDTMTIVFATAVLGFFTGLSLIVAIGAQNAFVLQQGIKRQHVLAVVLICGLTDALLEFLGILGIGFVIEQMPWLLELIRWGGVAFLVWYAYTAVRRALRPEGLVAKEGSTTTLKQTVVACLAISYLNPHVYLDTMVLVGSIGNAQGEPGRWWFLVGSMLASVTWFAALGFGARLLTRFFAAPRAWQILDWCIAVTMLVIAARLAFGGIH